jgi:hypothetical protein
MPQIVVWKVGLHDYDNNTLAMALLHAGLSNWLVGSNKDIRAILATWLPDWQGAWLEISPRLDRE